MAENDKEDLLADLGAIVYAFTEKGAIWKRELDQGVIAVSELGALVQTASRLNGDAGVFAIIFRYC